MRSAVARLTGVPLLERKKRWLEPAPAVRSVSIIFQHLGQLWPNRHQPAFEELALAHLQQTLFHIHIGWLQFQRFAQAQTRAVKQQKQGAHRVGRQALRSLWSHGLEETSQLRLRVNVRGEGDRHFGRAQRQGTSPRQAASQGKTIKPAQGSPLAHPIRRHRTMAIQIGSHGRRTDLAQADLSHGLAKTFQDPRFSSKAKAQRLLEGDVLLDNLAQLHSKPPRSKAATVRSPAKSTLA